MDASRKGIMLSEISQMEKGKYCMVSYVNCKNKTNKQNESKQKQTFGNRVQMSDYQNGNSVEGGVR